MADVYHEGALRRLLQELGRIRARLLLVNLLVLLVPVAGLEFARIYERQLLGGLEREGVMVLDTVPERLTVDAVNRYLALKTGVRM